MAIAGKERLHITSTEEKYMLNTLSATNQSHSLNFARIKSEVAVHNATNKESVIVDGNL